MGFILSDLALLGEVIKLLKKINTNLDDMNIHLGKITVHLKDFTIPPDMMDWAETKKKDINAKINKTENDNV